VILHAVADFRVNQDTSAKFTFPRIGPRIGVYSSRLEIEMRNRHLAIAVCALLCCCLSVAKKNLLPAYVVQARNVLVLIDPNAGTSAESPLANKKAQDDVEKALMKWGRLKPVMELASADLVIVIRTGNGKVAQPTIGGLPTNDRPVIVQPTDSGIRLGGKKGQPVGETQPTPQETSPSPKVEIGQTEDSFLVYDGKVTNPLDYSPVWRFTGKKVLRSPDVPAVAEFRKAIEETEKQLKQKP